MRQFVGSIRGDLEGEEPPRDVQAALEVGRGAFGDVIDLLHLHSKRGGGGDDPTAVLNPLMVLLSVSSWELLIHSLADFSSVKVGERETVGSFGKKSPSGQRGANKTVGILQDLTGGLLPGGYRLARYDSAQGKRLGSAHAVTGDDLDELRVTLQSYIELRNGVAHRVTGMRMSEEGFTSDADENY